MLLSDSDVTTTLLTKTSFVAMLYTFWIQRTLPNSPVHLALPCPFANELWCITFFLASMHFNKSTPWRPGPYGAPMCVLVGCAILHQTPNLPMQIAKSQPEGMPGWFSQKTEKLSPSYHHCFVTVRIVVGAQPSLLSLDQMLVMLYRGGSLDSNMKQEEEKKGSHGYLAF